MDPEDPYREPGILNERRRKYLLGRLDLNDSNERKIRGEIRDKTLNALLDFELLNEIKTDDLKQITELNDVWMPDEYGAFLPDRSGTDDSEEGGGYRFDQPFVTPHDKHAFRNPYLEESMVEIVRFLFRLSKTEKIPITSFIEHIIPEAYRRFNGGDDISVAVEIDTEEDV